MKALALALAVAALPLSAAKITEYPLSAGTGPYTLTLGPDGNIWVAEWGADKLARITNAGVVTELTGIDPSSTCNPFGITTGPDANLWFTCTTSGHVVRFDIAAEGLIFYPEPGAPTGQIAVGSDGDFWYGGGDPGALRRTDAGAADYVLQDQNLDVGKVSGVAAGPRGRTWLLDWQHGKILLGYVTWPARGWDSADAFGVTQNSFVVQCRGYGWVTMTDANQIRRVFDSEASPGISSHDYPLAGVANSPTGIACAPDGSVWFALYAANKIARFKNDGADTYEEFAVPTANSGPWGVAIGSDGSVWFAESSVHKVGRLQLHPPGDVNGDGQVSVNDVFYLINFLFAGGSAPVAP